MKQTNETRLMVGSLVRGMLPAGWRRYAVARGCTVQQWVDDFARRGQQLAHVAAAVADRRLQVHRQTSESMCFDLDHNTYFPRY